MSNAHRIAWIDSQIRARRYPNAASIAAQFEISPRQAARDIEYLRYSMGAPIAWVRDRGGYGYTDETFVLPALVITEDDVRVLRWLAHRYSAVAEPEAVRVADLLSQLVESATVDEPVRASRSGHESLEVGFDQQQARIHDTVRRGVDKHRKLRVHHLNRAGRLVAPVVRPYALTTRYGRPVVLLHDETNGEFGLVDVADIDEIEELAEQFDPLDRPPQIPSSGLPPPEPHAAVVRANAPILRHTTETLSDGTVRVEFTDSRRLLSDLLGSGESFEILSPQWLRQRARRYLQGLVAGHHDQ